MGRTENIWQRNILVSVGFRWQIIMDCFIQIARYLDVRNDDLQILEFNWIKLNPIYPFINLPTRCAWKKVYEIITDRLFRFKIHQWCHFASAACDPLKLLFDFLETQFMWGRRDFISAIPRILALDCAVVFEHLTSWKPLHVRSRIIRFREDMMSEGGINSLADTLRKL